MEKGIIITASEIGEYVYCKRGWWLGIKGLLKKNLAMEEGQKAHTKLSDWLETNKRNIIIAMILIAIGLLFTLLALINMLRQ